MPIKDRIRRADYQREWQYKNRIHLRELRELNWEERPWLKTLQSIRSRCLNKGHHYYKNGIKNYLTAVGIKFLWLRDKAYLLKKASIDRINGGDYTITNCRFIELQENLERSKRNVRQSETIRG